MNVLPNELQALLTERFIQAQDLPPERADEIAHKIAHADDDIAAAAFAWVQSDQMPSSPVIAGESPLSLVERYAPTQVFTALMLLRIDPARGAKIMQRFGDRNPKYTPKNVEVVWPPPTT